MKSSWPLVEKAFTGSTHRARPPAETLATYSPLMPRLGITRLANVTGLDCIGIPVVVAVRPASRSLATAQGKGTDMDGAKASALMESIETWHAERPQTLTRLDTFDELARAGAAVDVTTLQRRPGRTLSGHRPMLWALAHELMADEPRWVPWEAVSCDFSSHVVAQATFVQTTNGLASGNHLLEAVVHGLCEVIERDAVTLHNRTPRAAQDERRVDLDTVHNAQAREVLDRFHAAGVHVAVWDCTSDIGVPVLSALIVDAPAARPWRPRGGFRGHGCHPSRDVALLRALTEAAQARLTYISGSRDDLFPERFRALQTMEQRGVTDRQLSTTGGRPFSAVPDIRSSTFNDDLEKLLARLRAAGVDEVAVVDLTREELAVPVARVVVPTLENDIHRDRHYQPGPRAQRHERALRAQAAPA